MRIKVCQEPTFTICYLKSLLRSISHLKKARLFRDKLLVDQSIVYSNKLYLKSFSNKSHFHPPTPILHHHTLPTEYLLPSLATAHLQKPPWFPVVFHYPRLPLPRNEVVDLHLCSNCHICNDLHIFPAGR